MGTTFTARTQARNGVTMVTLKGELDLSTAPILVDRLTKIGGNGDGGIMLDLRGVTFIDSMGLRVFLQAHERATADGHRLIFIGAGSQARRLFALTGTEFLLDDQGSASALARFTGRGRMDGRMAPDGVRRDG